MAARDKNLLAKAKFIRDFLDILYPDIKCFLDHKDPFTLLVATVLSAQTTDKVVNKVTPELFKVASNPKELMQLPEEDLRKIIEPIGLSARKAKALKGLAERLCLDFDGEVPQTFEELESLPGVGHKTASVVMSQAFGKPAFPVRKKLFHEKFYTYVHVLSRSIRISKELLAGGALVIKSR
jgi:endonuclease-3